MAREAVGRSHLGQRLERDVRERALAEQRRVLDLLADAEKAKIDINALDGAKVQDVVTKVYASPPAVVARAKELIKD